MTETEYEELFQRGQYWFCSVVSDLNKCAEYVGHGKGFQDTYRREQDYKEICVALALLEKKLLKK